MKKRLLTLAGGIILIATVAKIIAIPAVAQTIRAAFVKNIDEKGRNPYAQTTASCTAGSYRCSYDFPAVPIGMRLVVENINAQLDGTDGANVTLAFSDGGPIGYYFPTVNGYQFSGNASYFVNAPFTAFINGNFQPHVSAQISKGTFNGNGQITITGYLVNLNN